MQYLNQMIYYFTPGFLSKFTSFFIDLGLTSDFKFLFILVKINFIIL